MEELIPPSFERHTVVLLLRLEVEVLEWATAEGAARFPGDAWPQLRPDGPR